jgi:hypothetical protein
MNLPEVLFAYKKGIMCTIFYSVNPVKIYVYEEGLVRFATVVSRKKIFLSVSYFSFSYRCSIHRGFVPVLLCKSIMETTKCCCGIQE